MPKGGSGGSGKGSSSGGKSSSSSGKGSSGGHQEASNDNKSNQCKYEISHDVGSLRVLMNQVGLKLLFQFGCE
jgi:hypothetical protein